jgi:hypothetical protein
MYINASTGVRTYDSSVGAGENISYLRLRGPCEMKVNTGINYLKRTIATNIYRINIFPTYKLELMNRNFAVRDHFRVS